MDSIDFLVLMYFVVAIFLLAIGSMSGYSFKLLCGLGGIGLTGLFTMTVIKIKSSNYWVVE